MEGPGLMKNSAHSWQPLQECRHQRIIESIYPWIDLIIVATPLGFDAWLTRPTRIVRAPPLVITCSRQLRDCRSILTPISTLSFADKYFFVVSKDFVVFFFVFSKDYGIVAVLERGSKQLSPQQPFQSTAPSPIYSTNNRAFIYAASLICIKSSSLVYRPWKITETRDTAHSSTLEPLYPCTYNRTIPTFFHLFLLPSHPSPSLSLSHSRFLPTR